MKDVTVVGIDLEKSSFQIHGLDARGKPVLRKKLSRPDLKLFFAQLPACTIGMEAGNGAHYWAKQASKCGHNVRLMAPQHVAPYRKSGKNDANDAEAIAEAVTHPNMRFVAIKEPEHIDLQMIHRIRERLIHDKVALCNQIRGFMAESGIVLSKSPEVLLKKLGAILVDEEVGLTPTARRFISRFIRNF